MFLSTMQHFYCDVLFLMMPPFEIHYLKWSYDSLFPFCALFQYQVNMMMEIIKLPRIRYKSNKIKSKKVKRTVRLSLCN